MTAVEWLVREIAINNNYINFDFWAAAQQAKEMEKKHVIDAYEEGMFHHVSGFCPEEYYEEKFKL